MLAYAYGMTVYGVDGQFIDEAKKRDAFVKKFVEAHRGEPKDQVREKLKLQVRQMVFYTTLIHEMGHNFGLRHNFGGSGDRKNYTDHFYSLEMLLAFGYALQL